MSLPKHPLDGKDLHTEAWNRIVHNMGEDPFETYYHWCMDLNQRMELQLHLQGIIDREETKVGYIIKSGSTTVTMKHFKNRYP